MPSLLFMQWNERLNKVRLLLQLLSSLAISTTFIASALAVDEKKSEIDFFADVAVESESEKNNGINHLTGYLQQQLGYSPKDHNYLAFSRKEKGISQARTTLALKYQNTFADGIEYELSGNSYYDTYYHSEDRDNFSNSEYSVMADDVELRNAYINLEIYDGLWLKLGKQIVAWGESEYVQIIDMVNPRDLKEFGIVDLEDSRIPVWASRLSYVGKQWGSDLVLVHKFEPNKTAGDFSDFDQYITLRNFAAIDPGYKTDVDFTNPDIFFRLFLQKGHSDISFVYAKSHQTSPEFDIKSMEPFMLGTLYPEIETFGVAANYVYGFWLIKTEISNKTGMRFAKKIPTDEFNTYRSYHQMMLGFEFSGINDVQIASEYIVNHIGGDEETLAQESNNDLFSNRINFQFLNQTLNVELLLAHWVQGHSDSVRLTANYDISDALKVSLGYIDFIAKNETDTLYYFQNSDRIFASLRYAF
jgi:hypothetical protein